MRCRQGTQSTSVKRPYDYKRYMVMRIESLLVYLKTILTPKRKKYIFTIGRLLSFKPLNDMIEYRGDPGD